MKNLSIRKFVCDCGYSNDRDINAAINIKEEGNRIVPECSYVRHVFEKDREKYKDIIAD